MTSIDPFGRILIDLAKTRRVSSTLEAASIARSSHGERVMGALLQLLKSDDFRRRTIMYTYCDRFAVVRPWLEGFDWALYEIFPEHASPYPCGPADRDLDGIREWLVTRLEGAGNVGWLGLIEHKFGIEKKATEKLFEFVDLFLQDLGARGLQAILEEHLEYESHRYEGVIFTSRLATRKNSTDSFWGEPVNPHNLKPYDAAAKRHLAWADYYRSLSRNHSRKAHYPWLPLSPDPPPPDPERPR